LAQGVVETAELRRFEKALLKELGYGLVLEREAGGRAVEAEVRYRYQVERGAVRESEAETGQVVSGKTLLDLAADDYADPRSLAESKQLMRHLLAYHLSGQQLQTRRVFIELQDV
jgi:DNA repair protein RecO (recombination protein O)